MAAIELLFFTITRVLHVATAIVVVGGMFFVRFILLPAATRELAASEHERLRTAVMFAWKKIVHTAIALFLITGGVNYYRVIVEGSHKGDALYHALLGTKILLALAVFFIASALTGRAKAFEPLRRNSRKWLVINLVLAAAIVAISGFVKVRGAPQTLPGTPPAMRILKVQIK